MSNVMDRKVVEMQFDNAQFERNVRTSLSTLDKLKAALKFDGVNKGLEDIERQSSSVSFKGMASGIVTITEKFSAFEQIAIGALRRIGEHAIDAGTKLVKSMSVDNISAGWSKFEEKTISVGTLIAQGFDLATVNEQLERLNFFTDETSYSFTNMISEIAKFTATGKGLEDSVTALMGIANWAALSGQNASTANRAMYQLSQAMGSGVMRKEDYKSIQNVSMDTKEFRQRALDAAEALGTVKKNADGTYTSIVKGAKKSTFNISQFADHLTQEAWFTSDVMMKVYTEYAYAVDAIQSYAEEHGVTASEAIRDIEAGLNSGDEELKKYNKDLLEFGIKAFKAAQEARTWADTVGAVKEAVASGFMKTFEIIFGEYDEAVDLWTDLAERFYDVFAQPINDFNDTLEEALKSSTPYINKYFSTIAEGEEDVADKAAEYAKKFGYSSEETQNYLLSLAHGNKDLANLITNYLKLNKLAGEGDKVIGASTDKIIEQTAALTGATTEQLAELKKIGDEYGYRSREFSKKMTKIFGEGKHGLYEITHDMLAAADGIDIIEKKDLDSYLENTLKFTSDQVEELHKLADEYGANSEQVDNYIKSLQNFTNFGHGHRGWTRTAIKSLLDITNGIGEAELGHKTGDIISYVAKLSGANEDSVKILWDLIEAEAELSKSTDADSEAIASNASEVEKWADEIANGNESLKKQILDIMRMQNEIDKMSGRRNLLEAFYNVWNYLATVLETVRKAFKEVFGTLDSGEIYSFTERIKKWSEALQFSDEKADRLKRIFKGLFSVFKIIGQVIKPILIPIKALFSIFFGSKGAIGETVASFGDWLTELANSGKVAEKAEKFFTGLTKALKPLAKAVKETFNFDRIKNTFEKNGKGIAGVFAVLSENLNILIDGFFNMIAEVTGWDVSEVKDRVLGFLEGLRDKIIDFLPTWEEMKEDFKKLGEIAGKLFDKLGFGKNKDKDADNVNKLADSVSVFAEAASKATEKISPFIDKFKEFAGEGGLVSGIKDFLGSVKDFFSAVSEKIGSDADKINFFEFFTDTGKAAALGVFGVALLTFAIGFKDAAWNFSKGFKWLAGVPSDLAEGYKFKELGKMILRFAIAAAILVGSVYLLSKLPEEDANRAFWMVTFIIGQLVGVMEVMNHTMTGSGAAPALFLAAFAFAIGKIVKAMVTMSKDIPPESLTLVALVLGDIMLLLDALIMVSGYMAYINNPSDMLAGAASIMIMAGAISLIVLSVKALVSNTDENKLNLAKELLLIIGAVLIVLTAVCGIISDLNGSKNMITTASSVAILAGAVAIVAVAISYIAKTVSAEDLGVVSLVLFEIVGALVILSIVANKLSGFGAKSTAGAASVVILAYAINIIAVALSLLRGMDPKSMIVAGLAISMVITSIGIALGTLGSMNPGKVMAAASALAIASASIVIFSVGMLIFIDVLHSFAKFSKDEFWPAIGYFVAAAAALGVAGALIGPAVIVFNLFGTALVTIALAANLFGMATILIADGFIKMALAVTSFGTAMKLSGKDFIDGLELLIDSFLGTIPKLARGLVSFGVEMAASIIDQLPVIKEQIKTLLVTGIGLMCDSLLASVGPITETILTLTINVLDALIENTPQIIDKLLTFLILVLDGVSNHIEEIITEVMEIVIGIINGISNRLPELIDAVMNFVEALIEGLIEALKDFKIDNIDDMLAAAINLMTIVTILSGITALMPLASAGVISLGALAVEIIGVLTALGGISKIPGIMDLIESGGGLLKAIGSALGDFIGGFVGGTLEGISASLPVIGANLSIFAVMAIPFIQVMKTVNDKVIEGATNMALALMAMTGAALVSSIADFMGAEIGWATFGQHMQSIGQAMASFSETTKDVDADNFAEMTKAAEGMAGMLAVVGVSAFLDTVLTFLGADIGWSTLRTKLVLIGQAMTGFSDETGTIDPDKFVKVAAASEKLVDMITKIKENNGVFDWIGDKVTGGKMKNFGEALAEFADGLNDFSSKTDGMAGKTSDINAGISAADKALAFSKRLNGDGSLLDTVISWLETKNLGSFGGALAAFASGISEFAEVCPKVQEKGPAIEAAVPYMEMAIDLSKYLNGNDGSLITSIANLLDTGNFALFSAALVAFGNGVLDFAAMCLVMKPLLPFISVAKPYIEEVIDIAKYLNDDDGIIGAIADLLETGNLAAFGPSLSVFASGIVEYANACREMLKNADDIERGNEIAEKVINFSKLLNTGSIIENVVDSATIGIFGASLASFGQSLKDYSDSLKGVNFDTIRSANAAAKGLTSVVNILGTSTFSSDLTSLAEIGISGFVSAFDTSKIIAGNAIRSFLKAATGAINSHYYKFKASGSHLVDGFILGMTEKVPSVIKTARTFGQKAVDNLNEVIEVQSPSKATERSGEYFGRGFVNGIDKFVDVAATSAADVGESALEGLSKSINDPLSSGLDGIDNTLTIRPVLDLTEIQNGTSKLNGMMNNLNGYSISGSMEFSRAMANSMASNNNNSEQIVNNLNKITTMVESLGDKLDRPNQTNNFNFNGLTTDEMVQKVKRTLTKDIIKEGRKWA